MNKSFCLIPGHWTNKELINKFGEEIAYHIVYLNKGNNLTQAPNGKGSLLYNDLIDMFGYQNAITNKAFFYTTDFRKQFGDWVNDKATMETDENGEPRLTDFLQIMNKADMSNNGGWRYRQGPQIQNDQTLSYDQAKKSYAPILNTLSTQFNIPWEEARLDGQPAAYQDGKVLIDFSAITPDAPFHEFMHPLILLIQLHNPKSLDRLVREALSNKQVVDKVNARYGKDKLNTDEYRMELVATAVGDYAVEARTAVEKRGILAAIQEFLKDVYGMLKSLMDSDYSVTIDDLSKLSLRELGFVMGVQMPKLQPTAAQTFYNQLAKNAIIKKDNYIVLDDVSRAQLNYYEDTLGFRNVDIIRNTSSADPKITRQVKITNPLSTKGKRLYRKKETIEKTGNEFFNKLIILVNELANVKENELRTHLTSQERHKTKVQANYLRNLVEDISKFRTLDEALHVMRSEIGKMNLNAEMPQTLEDISSSLKMLNGFHTITKYYNKNNTTPEIFRAIEKLTTAASNLHQVYTDKFTSQFKQEYLDKGGHEQVADQLMESIRDISLLELNTIGSSFAQNAVEQAVDHIIRLNAHQMNQNRKTFLTQLHTKLEKVGGDKADFSWMMDGDSIMLKTNPEFFRTQEEIRRQIYESNKIRIEYVKELKNLERDAIVLQAEGNIIEASKKELQMNEIRDKLRDLKRNNATWNTYHKFMRQYFNYELDETKTQAFEEDMQALEELYYEEDADGNPVLNEEKYQAAVDQYNPQLFQEYLNGDVPFPNRGWKYFKLVPKPDTESKLINPAYLKFTKEQKEFYDFFVEKFAEASNNIYDNYIDDNMTHDALIRDFMSSPEEVSDKLGMLQSAKEWLKDLIPEYKGAEELDIHGVNTGLNRKNIKFTPISAFLDKGKPLGNQNIISAFERFYDAGMATKYKNEVASLLDSGKELAATMKRLDIDKDGKIKTNLFNDPSLVSGQTKVSRRLEHIIENYLTKDAHEDMFGDLKIAGKKVPGDRLIDMINDFTRFRQLGLNPFSGISNLAMGAANNWTYSKRGEFFTDKELRKAYFKLRNNTLRYVTYNKAGNNDDSTKIKLLAEQMGISRQLLEKKHGNILDKAFTFQESGEFINQMASALAIMYNPKTIEALVGKGNKLVDRTGKEREVLDLFTVQGEELIMNDKDFDLKALGITNSRILTMSDAILKINKEIHGDYDQLNTMFLKRSALGRAVATFRTWLPQAVMQRFGSERNDYQLSAFYGKDIKRKGRYVSVVDMLKKEGIKGGAKMMGNLAVGFIPFVPGKISEDLNLGELDAANLNQTLSEMRLYITLFGAVTLMGKVSDEDEELEDSSMFNFIYNMTGRMENELGTFYYPTASYKLFKDIAPMYDTFEQMHAVLKAAANKLMDPDEDIYEKGFRKGTSKLSKEIQVLMPVTKQIQNIWSTISVQYEKSGYNR